MSKHDENMFGSAAWDTFNNDYDNSGIKENFGPEIESDKIEVVNTPVSELKSSAQTLLRLDIDKSGSMSGFTTAMNEALGRVKESIVTSTEVNRIQIAKTLFAGTVEPGGYTDIISIPFFFGKFKSNNSMSGLLSKYFSIVSSPSNALEMTFIFLSFARKSQHSLL